MNLDDVTYAQVNWGDGTTTTHTSSPVTHIYDNIGNYTITVNGDVGSLDNYSVGGSSVPTSSREAYTKVLQLGNLNYTDLSNAFYNARNLTSFNANITNTSNVISTNHMFYFCNTLTSLDVTNFDTSNVTDMEYMFCYCSSLTSLDVTNFDTSSATTLSRMFYNCSSLTSLDVTNFDTSNVTDMASMFRNCSSLTSLDVTNFDTSNVTDINSMFRSCSSLTSLDVTNFDTSNVSSFAYMFYDDTLLDVDVSDFNISSLLAADNMMYNTAFSNSNYDLLLIKWSAQDPNINNFVYFHAGSAKYTKTAERNVLRSHYWNITDGGPA